MTAWREFLAKAEHKLRMAWSQSAEAEPCGACGFRGRRRQYPVLWPALIEAWELSPEWAHWIEEREGLRCVRCFCALRSSRLATAIVEVAARQCGSDIVPLERLFDDPRAAALRIAEINSAGDLHAHLARCRHLAYSEYGGSDPSIRQESLLALSYPEASFDVAITSDTLEHVPDVDLALREVRRILKPGGYHVFTTPVLPDRLTRQRARIANGTLEHLLPPSYHSGPGQNADDFLVFYEFGSDFEARCAAAGYELEVRTDAANPALRTFIARKPLAG